MSPGIIYPGKQQYLGMAPTAARSRSGGEYAERLEQGRDAIMSQRGNTYVVLGKNHVTGPSGALSDGVPKVCHDII